MTNIKCSDSDIPPEARDNLYAEWTKFRDWLGKTIDLLSIGIVSEDGREFYAENNDANWSNASDWVKENVLPHLWLSRSSDEPPTEEFYVGHPQKIAQHIKDFLGAKPEMYAYYADYDWVVFCQLFGTMMDLPEGYPMYCRDIKQMLDEYAERNDVSLDHLKSHGAYPKQENEHNALDDARWTKALYEFVT